MSSFNQYQRMKVIGKGAFGEAVLVRKGSELFVRKEVTLTGLSTKEQLETEHEAALLKNLSHPNIIAYVESGVSHRKLWIVMAYAKNGDLDQYIKKKKHQRVRMGLMEAMCIFSQTLLALDYLHSKKILHRDLKSKNIFLDSFLGKTSIPHVKLGDFGIAKVLACTGAKAQTQIGTPYYLSPELCMGRQYSFQSDVWAMGVLLFEMLAFRLPFDARSLFELTKKIKDSPVPKLPAQFQSNADVADLVKGMLNKNPSARITIKVMLKRPIVLEALDNIATLTENVDFAKTLHKLVDKSALPSSNSHGNEDDAAEAQVVKSKYSHPKNANRVENGIVSNNGGGRYTPSRHPPSRGARRQDTEQNGFGVFNSQQNDHPYLSHPQSRRPPTRDQRLMQQSPKPKPKQNQPQQHQQNSNYPPQQGRKYVFQKQRRPSNSNTPTLEERRRQAIKRKQQIQEKQKPFREFKKKLLERQKQEQADPNNSDGFIQWIGGKPPPSQQKELIFQEELSQTKRSGASRDHLSRSQMMRQEQRGPAREQAQRVLKALGKKRLQVETHVPQNLQPPSSSSPVGIYRQKTPVFAYRRESGRKASDNSSSSSNNNNNNNNNRDSYNDPGSHYQNYNSNNAPVCKHNIPQRSPSKPYSSVPERQTPKRSYGIPKFEDEEEEQPLSHADRLKYLRDKRKEEEIAQHKDMLERARQDAYAERLLAHARLQEERGVDNSFNENDVDNVNVSGEAQYLNMEPLNLSPQKGYESHDPYLQQLQKKKDHDVQSRRNAKQLQKQKQQEQYIAALEEARRQNIREYVELQKLRDSQTRI